MSEQMKERVLSLLKNYSETDRKICALRYELEHPVRVSEQEMLETMVFCHGEEIGGTSGHVNYDKTHQIAVSFRQKAEEANREIVQRIIGELYPMEREHDRLRHFISLLDSRQAAVIRMTYIEHITVERIAEVLEVTDKTVQKIKKQGIENLCELYELTDPIRG